MLGLDAYSAGTLAFLVVSSLLAGLARGFSGFGSALIFMPLASTQVAPVVAAPLLLLVDIVLAAPLIPNGWRNADRRDVGTMLIGTLIGLPLGAWVLTRSDPTLIRWMIAAIIFPLLALLMSGWRYHGRPAPLLTVGVGWVSGFLSGVAQVGGPPIIVYWLGGAISAKVVRANIVLYFAISSLIACGIYIASGILTPAVIGLALLVGPAYGVGLYAGSHMFGVASEQVFRRVCYALIGLAGLISLPVFDGILR